MATTRPRSVPASKLRFGVRLVGAINGVNTSFTTPDEFKHSPPTADICVYYNGQRLVRDDDFVIAESGGPGSGYDTVVTLFVPVPGDKILVDYIAV